MLLHVFVVEWRQRLLCMFVKTALWQQMGISWNLYQTGVIPSMASTLVFREQSTTIFDYCHHMGFMAIKKQVDA